MKNFVMFLLNINIFGEGKLFGKIFMSSTLTRVKRTNYSIRCLKALVFTGKYFMYLTLNSEVVAYEINIFFCIIG